MDFNDLMNDLASIIANEGVNKDAFKMKRDYNKELRTLIKGIKAARKMGNYDDAIKGCDAGLALIKKFKEEAAALSNEDQSVLSMVIGQFLQVAKGFGLGLAACVPIIGIPAIGTIMKETVNGINTSLSMIGKGLKGELGVKDFNRYTKTLNTACDKYSIVLNKLKKKLASESAAGANVSRDSRRESRADEALGIDDFVEMGLDYYDAITAYESLVFEEDDWA